MKKQKIPILNLPPLIWLISLSTILSLTGGQIFGYNFSGWGWFIPFVVSLSMLPLRIVRASFPLFIWFPWILVLLAYLAFTEYTALQRTMQLIAPIVVGTVVSSLKITDDQLNDIFNAFKYLAVILTAIVGLKSGLFLTGILPLTTGLAPEVMTNIVLSSFFAATYASGARKDLLWWAVLAVNPVIALTRTAIVVNLLTLPLSFGPMKLLKRLFIFGLICLVGLGVFYSPRAQQKSFRTGSGEMSDVLNKDFNDSGRFFMWAALQEGIEDKPWWGHGTGACEDFVFIMTNGSSGYPHNDWLLFMYDYGKVGTSLFVLTILAAMLHAYFRGKKSEGKTRILFMAGASTFISLAMMMYTDNITIYASFFGNLQFTLLGLAYAVTGRKPLQASNRKRRIRIRW